MMTNGYVALLVIEQYCLKDFLFDRTFVYLIPSIGVLLCLLLPGHRSEL